MHASTRSRRSQNRSMAPAARGVGLAATSLALALLGCSKGTSKHADANGTPGANGGGAPGTTSDEGGVIIPAGTLPKLSPGASSVTLPDGNIIALTYVQGEPFMNVHGTLTDASYQRILVSAGVADLSEGEKVERLRSELGGVIAGFKGAGRILDVRTIPEVGYFSFLLPYAEYASLGSLKSLSRQVLVNPVLASGDTHRTVKALSAGLNAELTQAGLLGGDTSGYSGLLRIGIKEFESLVASDLPGVKVDGSDVRVGVTDTGVTFNHPAFEDAQGNSRVDYMKEFTGEGTLYFSPRADFAVRTPTKKELAKDPSLQGALFLSAQYLAPGRATAAPTADVFEAVKDLPLRVSEELRTILMTKGNGARFAILSETALGNIEAGELVDLNANGASDDALAVIHVPNAADSGTLYVDIGGSPNIEASSRSR